MALMLIALLTHTIRSAPVWFFLKPITTGIASTLGTMYTAPNLKTHLSFLEDQLATAPNGGGFFCGNELTGADILMIFPLEAAVQRVPSFEKSYPKVYLSVGEAYAGAGSLQNGR